MKALYTILMSCFVISSAYSENQIWLIGDSTVSSYDRSRAPLAGWGQMLNKFTKEGIVVINKAVGGRSTKSFIDEGRWAGVLPQINKGDFIFIQFGHNDQKKRKPKIYAEASTLYRDLLKKYITEARSKGATPVLVTSVCRRYFREGKIKNSLENYPEMMKRVAEETGTDVIDLNHISENKFNEIGEEACKEIFLFLKPDESPNYPDGIKDNTHFSEFGASRIAGWIVEDAKKQDLPVAKLFR